MVRLRQRRAEHRREPVAGVLVEHAVVREQHVGHAVQHLVQEPDEHLRRQLRPIPVELRMSANSTVSSLLLAAEAQQLRLARDLLDQSGLR